MAENPNNQGNQNPQGNNAQFQSRSTAGQQPGQQNQNYQPRNAAGQATQYNQQPQQINQNQDYQQPVQNGQQPVQQQVNANQQYAPQQGQRQNVAAQVGQYNQQAVQGQQPQGQQPYAQNQQYFPPQQRRQQVVHPVVKKGKKVSMKKFLIGCAVFFILLVGGVALAMYYLINNPDQLASMGLDRGTTKQLLGLFAYVFFGLLFLSGFGLAVTNIYRLVTVKNKSKIGYIFGFLLGIIVFIGSIALGSKVINAINAIPVEETIQSDKLLLPSLQLKDQRKRLDEDASLKPIAPASMGYVLNRALFNTQVYPTFGGQVEITSMTLHCGTDQTVSINLDNLQTVGSCLYYQKGNYPLSIDVGYTNKQTSEKMTETVPAGSMNIASEIKITPYKSEVSFNDSKTEIIVGKAPRKVTFDASEVFKDFGLTEYKIIWDGNGDGESDKQNATLFTYTYKEAKVHTVTFRVPGLNDYIYAFPVRVEQSDVPICEVNVNQIKGTKYNMQTQFIEKNTEITEYAFSIIDVDQNRRILDTIKNTDGTLNYTFPGAGTYAIQTRFITNEGKKGECESDDIAVGKSDFDVFYELFYKSPQAPEFKQATDTTEVSLVNDTITLREIPTVLQLEVSEIVPQSPTSTVKVLYKNKPILAPDDTNYEITVDDSIAQDIVVLVEDKNRDAKTEKRIRVEVEQDDIIGKIIVKPDTVGTDPFTVRFDASTTIVNDPTDEIVYFSWDFGDGEEKENFSQSIVSHTYKYDYENENGTYKPKLTLETKRGREVVVELDSPIIVKKPVQTLKIHVDSHPAQLAKKDDKVDFSLQLNGYPEKIVWDFGNGNTLECNGRECVQTAQIYREIGTYSVKAQVYYPSQPVVEGEINIKVE